MRPVLLTRRHAWWHIAVRRPRSSQASPGRVEPVELELAVEGECAGSCADGRVAAGFGGCVFSVLAAGGAWVVLAAGGGGGGSCCGRCGGRRVNAGGAVVGEGDGGVLSAAAASVCPLNGAARIIHPAPRACLGGGSGAEPVFRPGDMLRPTSNSALTMTSSTAVAATRARLRTRRGRRWPRSNTPPPPDSAGGGGICQAGMSQSLRTYCCRARERRKGREWGWSGRTLVHKQAGDL